MPLYYEKELLYYKHAQLLPIGIIVLLTHQTSTNRNHRIINTPNSYQ